MKTASPPNPCELKYPQTGDGDVHCLEFSSTDEQNACWTALDGSSSSVNNNNLKPIVDKCNTGDVDAGDEAYLDNGDKNETLHYIRDKFYGDGHPPDGPPPGSPAGVDRYPSDEVPSRIDSWVVKLPVFECQEDDHCAGPDTFAITGGVCFEIREILSPPHDPGERLIKGRFLCPGDPLFQEFCYDPDDPPQTGTGCNFGMHASIPVLVE
jgi:hypothetical protein